VLQRVFGYGAVAEEIAPDGPDDIDKVVSSWRQGDCVVAPCWFVHGRASAAGQTEVDLVESGVIGFAIVTQTCDLVRSHRDRPFAEVCPLVEVDADILQQIRRAQRPGYAYIPGLAARSLVADLDRTMTVEKEIVAAWARTPGCSSDVETRAFADALCRKRGRFAFPDDFVLLAKKLQSRLIEKHDRNSPEGKALRALREIRVKASPSWDAAQPAIMFWFIRETEDEQFEGASWSALLTAWLKLVPKSGRFAEVFGQVVTLEELTAADYVESDPLDLDNLSQPSSG
jgi:hypothetical protein